MKVLILGRHPGIMQGVLAQLQQAGFEAQGCFSDEETLQLIRGGDFEVVAIGGGVEPASRQLIKAECLRHSPGPEVVEIFGPGTLLPRLEEIKNKKL